jgi:hypothetical protein
MNRVIGRLSIAILVLLCTSCSKAKKLEPEEVVLAQVGPVAGWRAVAPPGMTRDAGGWWGETFLVAQGERIEAERKLCAELETGFFGRFRIDDLTLNCPKGDFVSAGFDSENCSFDVYEGYGLGGDVKGLIVKLACFRLRSK